MDQAADMQAQIMALRIAVEGVWLSILHADPDPVAVATRLRDQNVAGVRAMPATAPRDVAARDAVAVHTQQLWNSIVWQLGGEPDER